MVMAVIDCALLQPVMNASLHAYAVHFPFTRHEMILVLSKGKSDTNGEQVETILVYASQILL